MSGILEKYSGLSVHSDRDRTIDLQKRVSIMARQELESKMVAEGLKIGYVVLQDSPGEPDCVLELVMSPTGADSIATLYRAHPAFNSRDTYRDARKELLELVDDIAMAGEQGALVMCPVRGRPVWSRELSLQQMLELIRPRAARFLEK